ncbi:sortase [Microbacterium album]|uniref:Sortase n=1 Tax=Microbacterium album TaxID=2053191 RepID=A0A917MQ30_9MICO|nr:class E sortase [Microbacterium album]GGH49868.1 sortase [Microbacterium album]
MSIDTRPSAEAPPRPAVDDTIAPPTRHDPSPAPAAAPPPAPGATPGAGPDAQITAPLPRRRPLGPRRPVAAGGTPPRKGRRRRLLPDPAPRSPAPRDLRWWTGAALLTVAVLLAGFVLHAALLSAFQHYRAQTIAYDELRTSLAKAEAPVGQLDLNERAVAPGTPVALLEAPAIGLSEVVVNGTDAQTLRGGIGLRRDSVMPGQAGTAMVFGRQLTYGGPFGQLHRLEPGDELTITTGQGTHTYRVFGVRRAGDPMPDPPRAGEGRLELLTADGLPLFASGVLHVDATLVSEPQQNPARVLTVYALGDGELPMGQDHSGWFTAFFLLVFFVAGGIGTWWLWTTWGRWHAWVIGVPLLVFFGIATADQVMNALPNLI